MRCCGSRSFLITSCVFLGLSAAGFPARADLSLGFSNGLTAWNLPDSGVTTQGDLGTVTALNGQATITESTNASETDLTLNFTIPTGAQGLQFTLVSVVADSPPTSTPDAFGASLLDPTGTSPLVSTVSNSDSFYTRDVVDSPTVNQLLANGVSVSPGSGGTLAVVAVDISSLGGQQAQILFRLIGGGDANSSSSVTISDVNVIAASSPLVVPEPSTVFLAGLAILGWVGHAACASRRPRDSGRVLEWLRAVLDGKPDDRGRNNQPESIPFDSRRARIEQAGRTDESGVVTRGMHDTVAAKGRKSATLVSFDHAARDSGKMTTPTRVRDSRGSEGLQVRSSCCGCSV